jgi:hypothetical protein
MKIIAIEEAFSLPQMAFGFFLILFRVAASGQVSTPWNREIGEREERNGGRDGAGCMSSRSTRPR